jgi:hypothetical protein
MVIPGYDPDDLDEVLTVMVEREGPENYLDQDERARWEDGESLLDLLQEDDVERLVRKAPDDIASN